MTDRFSGSTLAYLGYGRGLDLPGLRQLVDWATGGVQADLSILVEVPPALAAERSAAVAATGSRRWGRSSINGWPTGSTGLAADDPDPWVVVDGTGGVDEVADRCGRRCWTGWGIRPVADLEGPRCRWRPCSTGWSASRRRWPNSGLRRAGRCMPISSRAAGVGQTGSGPGIRGGILCPDGGCGACSTCRRVLAGTHPDLVMVERSGASLSIDDARSVGARAQRRPLEASRQVLVVTDIHLALLSAPALLKTIEEPPPSTVFVLVGDELLPELATIASRCVEVAFDPVPVDAVRGWLVSHGVSEEVAASVAVVSGGRLDRANCWPPIRGSPNGWSDGGRCPPGWTGPGPPPASWPPSCWHRPTKCSARSASSTPRRWPSSRSGPKRPGQGHHRSQGGGGPTQAGGTPVADRRVADRVGDVGRRLPRPVGDRHRRAEGLGIAGRRGRQPGVGRAGRRDRTGGGGASSAIPTRGC